MTQYILHDLHAFHTIVVSEVRRKANGTVLEQDFWAGMVHGGGGGGGGGGRGWKIVCVLVCVCGCRGEGRDRVRHVMPY